jgi:hypothetical protein
MTCSDCIERTAKMAAAMTSAAMIAMCVSTGSFTNSASAPSPAPSIVPKLKKAWKIGITVLPSTRSFAAPETFMATSVRPEPAPNSTRPPKLSAKTGPMATPTPAITIPSAMAMSPTIMIGRAPNRAVTWLDAEMPMIEPSAMPKISSPICAVVASSESRTAGTRATQLASASPGSMKTTNVALRQR